MKTASSEALEEATLGARPEHTASFAEGVKFSSDLQVFQAVGRTAAFWRRASRIYFGYKSAQARAAFLGHPGQTAKDNFWHKHHAWAGAEMYSLAVDLRGFYLKVSHEVAAAAASVLLDEASITTTERCLQRTSAHMMLDLQVGQFLGARGDFVPMPICQQLSRLHDQVIDHLTYASCCTCACQSQQHLYWQYQCNMASRCKENACSLVTWRASTHACFLKGIHLSRMALLSIAIAGRSSQKHS